MASLRVSAACLLLLIATAAADAGVTRCRVEDCPNFRAIRYHEELGCVRSDGSKECCPTRYNCSLLDTADKTKCHYKGNTYEPGSRTGDEVEFKCILTCECSNDRYLTRHYGGESTFLCPRVYCLPRKLPAGRQSECYQTASMDTCCSNGVRCVNDTETPPVECRYQGKTYREDQLIDAARAQCRKCVCQKGFDGTLDGPWCKKKSCDYTLYSGLTQLKESAPIFREGDNCCAQKLHSPSEGDKPVWHSQSRWFLRITDDTAGGQCSFGGHRLSIGDELLVGSDGCVKCRCEVPPFITCTSKADPECDAILFA